MQKLDDIRQVLKQNRMRVTQSRISVASVLLGNSSKHLTAEEIFKKINLSKNLNCDQVSVYRILTAFEGMGIIHKSVFQGEATRYCLNKNHKNHDNHQHFFKCKSCSLVEPFGGCLVGKKEKELKGLGYTNLEHHLEITGLCPACS